MIVFFSKQIVNNKKKLNPLNNLKSFNCQTKCVVKQLAKQSNRQTNQQLTRFLINHYHCQ